MTRQRLVVIGNGMAGMRLVETLCRLAPQRYAITVIGEEPRGNYNRILLSPVLAGEKAFSETVLHDAGWYLRHGVRLLAGEPALALDRRKKRVTTARRRLGYDLLVLATGSRPLMPPLPGCELAGVHGFRTLDDVEAMLSRCAAGRPALVLGGGVLGIEAAAALARRGMSVSLVHRGAHLMERQLDAVAGRMLQRNLQQRGIVCRLGCEVSRFLGQGALSGVSLSDGDELPCDLAVIAIGVRPEIGLAQAAGLECARGVCIDDRMRTADPAIFALGECAQFGDAVPGLVAPCWQQAALLARQLAGEPAEAYAPAPQPLRLKVSGIEMFSAGEVMADERSEIHSAEDPLAQHYRRLLMRDGVLCGALLYGDAQDGPLYLQQLGQPVNHPAELLFGSSEPAAPQASGERITEMNKPVLVVAGHGMVGQHFLEQLVARELHLQFHILVFCEESVAAYDRVHLSEFFSGRSADSLAMAEEGFFERYGIELRLGQSVCAIDRRRRCVIDAAGRETAYDRLVLATGSYPFVPPIPGNDRPGCLVYRTLDDLAAIAECAQSAGVGVVVGGGLLGLEAANALRQLGLKTHVVEFAPRLMGVQLDDGGAAMLRRKIEALGVSVHTGKQTQAIGDGLLRRHSMNFADGESLEADLILFSAGIRPRDQLAREAGLEVGPRGGIVIDSQCCTEDEAIYAIGECALWNGQIFGLVAPGYQMARTLADRLAGRESVFCGADMSTKLKLLGVEVASIGDAHGHTAGSQSYSWVDGPAEVYKKLVVDAAGQRLLGAVLVGDSGEYGDLLQMMLNDLPLLASPESLILPASAGAAPKALGVSALPASAQICSCHNVSKGDISCAVEQGCGDLAAVKSCTKAGTGCGGCAALVKQVMEHALQQRGVTVKKDVCEHFAYSRQALYHLVRVGDIRTFDDLLARHGQGWGCEVCKPLIGSILASCWNEYLLKPQHLPLQDTNDRFFANIQKDGTYSVVPRVPAGEITPEGLIAIGQIAQRYRLYTKITGGQRVDMFGARLEQLPDIWRQLVAAGFETGHAYGKSLRTVKSCVGSSWCRYGVQDSTALAIALENRYKGLRSPHKLKMAVSGCTRECAEAQSKDVGVIATDKGWNLYLCGNGGMKPRHADLFASDLDTATLIRTIDRFLMFYIRTADRLQRTSSWMDNLEGGLDYLRQVVLEDSLGIAAELEKEMQSVVASYQCEWQTTLASPDRLKLFRGFVNSEQPDEAIAWLPERGQHRPAGLRAEAIPVISQEAQWQEVCLLADIPANAGVAARLGQQQIALFHLPEHGVYALANREPDSDANVLARGLVGDVAGEPVVISPLYKQRFRLRDGVCVDSGEPGVTVWPVRVESGRVWVCSQPLAVQPGLRQTSGASS
ncbi:nitrite reductase large subunit NirB [Serratia ficaria]|uniref:nitrite reductase large subunit NirB n=1 Tax=Serratia ficaria TaxID=61651 RepID=UPI0021780A0C|nr:nitrite reductase large subunit NirB [Serratia ficaria]CAI0760698.1 Benzene 1,2-dioxygenase system ferredoxin--NAD(+) reductase subunit [Serratia ficaria]CAI1627317.1 Benzene 1,2-dioxygenase system ferredoxin--NAD(+) reductase subunit [Serratia ficaria]